MQSKEVAVCCPSPLFHAIQNFKKKAIYDTGVTAGYGDRLITLETCAYHVDDGRFAVVARRK